MNRKRPLLGVFEIVVLAVSAAILIYTLEIPPIVGLADNGDFYKMMSKFGLEHGAQTREDRYFGYFDTIYVPDPVGAAKYQEVWHGTLISSEIIFMATAVWLHRLLDLGAAFHLQLLGLVHIVVFMFGEFLLLLGLKDLSLGRRIIGAVFSVIMFLDTNYIAYFNSAYTETAAYLFLLLLIAAATHVIFHKPYAPAWVSAYFLFAFLFSCSRYPNGVMYPLLALFGVLLTLHTRQVMSGLVALAATLAGGILVLGFMRGAPPAYTEFSLYNHFFNSLLRFSPTPGEDLKEFGLDPALLSCSGTTYYEPRSAVYNQEAYRGFREKVSTKRVIRFYLHHPRRVMGSIYRTVSMGMKLAPGYGNYEKSAGKPPGSHSQGFVIWSSLRDRLMPKNVWVVAVVLAISLATAFWPRDSVGIAAFRSLIVTLCALQLGVISCASDPSDVIRHMFAFNLLWDLILMLTSIDLLFRFAARILGSEIVEETCGN